MSKTNQLKQFLLIAAIKGLQYERGNFMSLRGMKHNAITEVKRIDTSSLTKNPTNKKKIITPTLQLSALSSYGWFFKSSGAT
mmetsp:Transcript_24565/g.51640  ORF Transcript_24565/g.51640 Transcript_24565/m.51640 type:complete len:82 (+) Transcript_24565:156-401(+)